MKTFKIALLLFIISLGVNAQNNNNLFIDLSKYDIEITTGDVGCNKFKTISYFRMYQMNNEKSNNYKRSGYGEDNINESTEPQTIDEFFIYITKEAKSKGADAIINLKFEATQYGYYISGEIIKYTLLNIND